MAPAPPPEPPPGIVIGVPPTPPMGEDDQFAHKDMCPLIVKSLFVHNSVFSTTPSEDALRRTTEEYNDWGVRRALHLLGTPNPPRRLPPTPPTIPATEPYPLPGGSDPTRDEITRMRMEITRFRHLLPARLRTVYDNRLRLDLRELRARLGGLPEETRARNGLRPSWLEGAHPKEVETPLSRLQSLTLLMDAWSFVDPLQLHMYADMRRFGMNLATNTVPSQLDPAGARPRNLPSARTRTLRKIVGKKMMADVGSNRCLGPLSTSQLAGIYPRCFTVPLGLAPKDNGTSPDLPEAWRLVKSWSRRWGRNPSLSDRTDKVKTAFIRPGQIRAAVHTAFKNKAKQETPHILTIDFDSAFTQNAIAHNQRLFMTYYIQDVGYFIRTAGDFGMKTCGYRFELQGLLACSMYKIMEKRIFVSDEGAVWLAPPTRPKPWCWSNGDGSLSRASCDLLSERSTQDLGSTSKATPPPGFRPVSLSGFLRWVDDMMNIYISKAEAIRHLHAIAFLHRRYGWLIKRSKVMIGPMLPFTGIMLHPETDSMMIPSDKRKKYSALMESIENKSFIPYERLEQVAGVASWVTGVLPQLAPLVQVFYRSLHAEPNLSPRRVSHSLSRAARIFREVLYRAPNQIATLERNFDTANADAIIHGDWAGDNPSKDHPQKIAAVLVSHGLYTVMDVPMWFKDACLPGPVSPNAGETLCIALAAATFSDTLTGLRTEYFSDSSGLVLRSKHFQSGPSNSKAIDRAFELGAIALVEANACFSYTKMPRDHNLSDPLVNANGSVDMFLQKWSSRGLPGVPSFVKPRLPKPLQFWTQP